MALATVTYNGPMSAYNTEPISSTVVLLTTTDNMDYSLPVKTPADSAFCASLFNSKLVTMQANVKTLMLQKHHQF